MQRILTVVLATVLALTVPAIVGEASASPGSAGCDNRANKTYKSLLECVTLEGAREHQAVLQGIADGNGGTRVSGTPGYDASADYAADVFEEAGLDVTIQEFDFQTFITTGPTTLEQVAPNPGSIETTIMSYSGSGDVTAAVSEPAVSPATGLTTGCDAVDFAGFNAGDIALISRGTCAFAVKATNAFDAGAAGVVIYNNAPGVLNGTLGEDFSLDIPVSAVTQEVGQTLADTPGLVLRLATSTFRGQATTSNVIAETPWGSDDNVVMVGAHLDSVNAGPGINDNGSGTAAILETAQAMSKTKAGNKVRFALWGAEESGLVGSEYYVENLPVEEREKIALYLNFDMIGSPNHVFFVYDGDDSDQFGAPAGPEGSAEIETLFEDYYAATGNSWKGTDFSGRSDYGPFIAEGVDIPSGGLFTGAEGIKTDEEADVWGGEAGEQYDPCYHLECDTFDNVNLDALDVNVDAVAYATMTYAYSTESVNGVPGSAVPGGDLEPVKNQGRSYPSDASQGGLHDHDHEFETS